MATLVGEAITTAQAEVTRTEPTTACGKAIDLGPAMRLTSLNAGCPETIFNQWYASLLVGLNRIDRDPNTSLSLPILEDVPVDITTPLGRAQENIAKVLRVNAVPTHEYIRGSDGKLGDVHITTAELSPTLVIVEEITRQGSRSISLMTRQAADDYVETHPYYSAAIADPRIRSLGY